jgi:metallophosphoesterase (TIGR00282 family)
MAKILCIGDIIGKPGRKAVKHMVPKLRKEEGVDFVIANSDNVTSGMGINKENAHDLLACGIDIFTAGNHIWRHHDILELLDAAEPIILRPANFPVNNPGKGYRVFSQGDFSIAVINLQCRGFMTMDIDCPFLVGDHILSQPEVQKATIKIMDIHGETTSEKQTLYHYFNGRVSHLFGTHTHVQTNDARISSKGTSYITDVGGCMVQHSIIGFEPESIIRKFLTQMPEKYIVEEKGDILFSACIVDVDPETGHTQNIQTLATILSL